MFTVRQNKMAQMMKVLAHPARIAILQQIIQKKACVCGSLADELGLAQPTISQHLKELKNAEIIKGNIEGSTVCYCINEKTWVKFRDELQAFFSLPVNIKDECC